MMGEGEEEAWAKNAAPTLLPQQHRAGGRGALGCLGREGQCWGLVLSREPPRCPQGDRSPDLELVAGGRMGHSTRWGGREVAGGMGGRGRLTTDLTLT